MTTETVQNQPKPDDAWAAAAAASNHAENERKHPPRRFSEMLPVRLTETEIAERARRASVARRQIAEYESQKQAATSHWKAKIELAENERDSLLDTIDSGVEERAVECIETFEWRTGTVVITRADTTEKIRERAMTAQERQPSLPAVNTAQTTLPPAKRQGDDVRTVTSIAGKVIGTTRPVPTAIVSESSPVLHDGDDDGYPASPEGVDAMMDDLDELADELAAITAADSDDLDAIAQQMGGGEITDPQDVLDGLADDEADAEKPKAKRTRKPKKG